MSYSRQRHSHSAIKNTVHPNPGLTESFEQNLKRAKTSYPTPGNRYIEPSYMNRDEDNFTLEQEKNRAFQVWADIGNTKSATTYQQHFSQNSQSIEQPWKRIPSPTRRNNPHPKLVFLECRLNHVPGFHNSDITVGKPAFKCDASNSQAEQERRHALRSKFQCNLENRTLKQYQVEHEDILNKIQNPYVKQAAQSWLQQAPKNVIDNVRSIMKTPVNTDIEPAENLIVPSIRGYNKLAGPEEMACFERLRGIKQKPLGSELTLKNNQVNDTARLRTKRGDFLMHPEWSPKFRHHNLNGLSLR